MAFGIDDSLAAAAAAIKLTDTVVKTISAYRKKGKDIDIDLLIEEVRVTALKRLDEADFALMQLEKTLREKGIDLNKTLVEVIGSTPFWKPFESHRMKRVKAGFDALANAAYNSCDDIAALVRCREKTKDMGNAVVDSYDEKHDFYANILDAKSVAEAIRILREQLESLTTALG